MLPSEFNRRAEFLAELIHRGQSRLMRWESALFSVLHEEVQGLYVDDVLAAHVWLTDRMKDELHNRPGVDVRELLNSVVSSERLHRSDTTDGPVKGGQPVVSMTTEQIERLAARELAYHLCGLPAIPWAQVAIEEAKSGKSPAD